MIVKQNLQLDDDVRVQVRERYGQLAADFEPTVDASCCGPEGCVSLEQVEKMYETPDVNALPVEVTGLSLGCGDPVTLAALEPGQTVLDLGSGGGIDCFLAAKQVGPAGQVIGVDMTTEERIIQILKQLAKEGKTMMVVHHDLSSVKAYFDDVMLLNQRLIAFGPTASTFTEENMTATYGPQLTMLHNTGLVRR